MSEGLPTWCGEQYANGNHVRLEKVAVHPDYQHHDIGSRLVRDGLELFADERLATLLLTNDVSKRMFEKLGFRSVGSRVVKESEEQGEETFLLEGMIKE